MIPRRPKLQGDFDSACGFYAVHNALALLYPSKVTSDDFSTLLRVLSEDSIPRQFFFGTGRNELNKMLTRLLTDERFHGTSVLRPWWKGGKVNLGDYWACLGDHLATEGTCAIMMFGHEPNPDNTWYHWSVVRSATANSLLLYDSDHIARIPRKRSRMWDEKAFHSKRPFVLASTATFLLKRSS